jgi:cellulose synthase/poly-beta-1,6-N-acetylglucosamine synthase-like glycosyltransferase
MSVPPDLAPAATFAGLLYAGSQLLLLGYASHRWLLLWRRWRAPRSGRPAPPASRDPGAWPSVTVQLPLYNEQAVAARLIGAAGALDYPRDRLEIQVLDDSTDGTRAIAAAAAGRLREQGVRVEVLHRRRRAGFKAGALAAGLARARGDLVAVFDADFVPPSDFLRRAVPHLDDPGVGMVQARWGHLNRDGSWLTAAQAVLLDAHFVLEHEVRMRCGLWFNFNGTAGVWRRSCIEAAGGWSHDTLTEDLDLSYRAQMAGWRFVYDGTLEAPAELPAHIEAFKSQQRRWAKGAIQTARKVLPRLLAGPAPARLKVEAFFHLTGNAAYPLLLLLTLLLAPVLALPPSLPAWAVWALQGVVLALGLLPVALFLAESQRALGRPPGRAARDVAAALVLGVGLALNNSRAVLEGLAGPVGEFERTPKSGAGGARGAEPAAAVVPRGAGGGELALALYTLVLVALTVWLGEARALPFLALLAAGFGAVGLASRRDAGRFARGG